MTKSEIDTMRTLLKRKQAEVTGALHFRDEIVIEKASDALDEVQAMGERELAVRALDRDSHLLRQIRRALARADSGDYGVCLNCEEDIAPRRLAALPWAAYCIRCQEKVDRLEIEVDESADFLLPAA